jgi:hypothetical protein
VQGEVLGLRAQLREKKRVVAELEAAGAGLARYDAARYTSVADLHIDPDSNIVFCESVAVTADNVMLVI